MKCNSYHAGKAVLLGDAAHSTGGASGQGCNSALGDAAALATLLEREAEAAAGATEGAIASALRAYSSQRVPEGQALLELSIGPSKPGPLRKALGALSTAVGAVLNRRVFVVFGGLGAAVYFGHLAADVFEDSWLFPVALTAIGLLIIYLGIVWQKHEQAITRQLRSVLPAVLRELLEARA